MSRIGCLTVGILAVSLLARAQEPSAPVVLLWPKGAPWPDRFREWLVDRGFVAQ